MNGAIINPLYNISSKMSMKCLRQLEHNDCRRSVTQGMIRGRFVKSAMALVRSSVRNVPIVLSNFQLFIMP